MAKVLVTEAYLQDIADSIREKNGSTDTYTPAEMSSAIDDIPTGITPTGTKQISITSNGTTTEDVTNYANAQISVNVPSSSPTLVTKTITENGTYNASSDNADGYSSVTVNVSGGGFEPFDTYEFNVPSDINYEDATGTALRTLATFDWHQAMYDKIDEYSSISETDYPFAKTGYARILFIIEPKSKSQIVADATYIKNIRKELMMYMGKNASNKIVRSGVFWRAQWRMNANATTFAYTGSLNTSAGAEVFDIKDDTTNNKMLVQTQLTRTAGQMISAGDYIVKCFDVTGSVM